MESKELFAVIATILTIVVPPLRAWVQSRTTPDKLAHVMDSARVAVRAAEQMGTDLGELLPGDTNAQKLAYASTVVTQQARRFGLRLKPDEVLAYVHTALREMDQLGEVPADD